MKYTIEYKAKYGDRYYWFRHHKRYTSQRRLFQALEQLRKDSKHSTEYRPVHWYPPKNHNDRIPDKLVKPLSFWNKLKAYLYK